MPDIRETFTVGKPIDVVWRFFQDVSQVADCMPGVQLTNGTEPPYKGTMNVKLGPITSKFQGEADITDLDETSHEGSISAKGVDPQGGSRATAKVKYCLSQQQDATQVEIIANISLQGRMAQFGRTGLLQDVSSRMTKEFATCLEQKLTAETQDVADSIRAKDVRGFTLLLQSFWAWLKRVFGSRFSRDTHER
jgi:carbon monoxide dehydrogenase subunit G